MKEIKLGLFKVGESFILDGKKLTIFGGDKNTHYFYDEQNNIVSLSICEIIESPEPIADDGKPSECEHFMTAVCLDCKREYCNCHAPLTAHCRKCGIDPNYIKKHHIADDGKKVEEKLFNWDIGDVVKFRDNPFDEQIKTELQKYLNQKDKLQRITDIKPAPYNGTSGWWIKTDLNNQWIDKAWFKKAEEKPPLKLRVGGVYKDKGNGVITITDRISDDCFLCDNDKQGMRRTYNANGKGLVLDTLRAFDLIEEVQPEDKLKFDPIFAAAADEDEQRIIDAENELDKKFTCSVLKYPGELESLRKENEEYRLSINDLAKRYDELADLYDKEKAARIVAELRRLFPHHEEVFLQITDQKEMPSEQLEDLIQRLDKLKPEGNPFKVGQTIAGYDYTERTVGKIIKFRESDSNIIAIDTKHGIRDFHYKQCELLNE